MKRISILSLVLFAFMGFYSCETEDDVVFTAGSSDIAFNNTFLGEYILTPETAANVGERFTWNSPNVGTPTNLTYTLESSIASDFSTIEAAWTTNGNEIAVSIGEMLSLWNSLANAMLVDDDPNTEIPNAGQAYFRLKYVAGDSGLETFTSTQALTLVRLEQGETNNAVCEFDQLYGVGAGLPTAGWSWDTPVEITCTGEGVYTANVNFSADGDANFRFFTANADWGSGRNYPYFVDEGYTIDPNFEDAMDGDNNFKFVGTSGLYYLTIDDTNKVISLSDPVPTGVCEFDQLWGVGAGLPTAGWSWDTPVQLLCTGEGVYSGYAEFSADGDANFRFFTANADWGSGRNYPYYVDEGYTIDANFEDAMDGDNNFKFVGTSGIYLLTIDDTNKTITLE